MKNEELNLDILENADSDTIERMAEDYTALDLSEADRIFKLSQKSYLNKTSDDTASENSKNDEVSGVELYRRPKWYRFIAAASSFVLVAGAITAGVYLLKGFGNSPDNISITTEEITSEAQYTEISAEKGAPFGDITGDRILFMTPAVAPYLIDTAKDSQKKIAETFNEAVWTEIDESTPIPDGESTVMYVYNNNKPYELIFYGDYTVEIDNGVDKKRWQIPPEVFEAVWEEAHPDEVYDRLIRCELSDVSIDGVWKNVVTDRVDYDMSTKDGVYYKMLNTIDYFDKASGNIVCSTNDLSECYFIEFETNLNMGTAYCRNRICTLHDYESVLNGNADISALADENTVHGDHIEYSDGEMFYSIDPEKNEYQRYYGVQYRAYDERLPDEKRHETDAEGYDVWSYRADTSNCPYAKMSILPQEITFGFLTDLEMWEIVGTENFSDRECVVINGKLTGSYSDKQNVVDFVFYVDKETGALLKYEGYDIYGALSQFLITDNIAFDSQADNVRYIDLSQYSENTDNPFNSD